MGKGSLVEFLPDNKIQVDYLPNGTKVVTYSNGVRDVWSDHNTYIELTKRQWLDLVQYIIERGQKPEGS